MEIVRRRISELREDPLNLRHHGKENVEMIKRSLQEFGQYKPLVVDAVTGVVLVGNGRFRAMRELGWTECDCVEIDRSRHEGVEVIDNRLNEQSQFKDEIDLSDWLKNEKGIDWWGVDSAKFKELKGPEPRPKRDCSGKSRPRGPVCPCCGRLLRKLS